MINVNAENDFIVTPTKTELSLNLGESIVKDISIANRSKETAHFTLSTEDFVGASGEDQSVKLLGEESSLYSLKNFIVPEIREFNLLSGETITLSVKISVPPNASPRGYYGALIVSNHGKENPSDSENENIADITSRIGSLFLIRINGKSIEQGSVEDFKIIGPKEKFYTESPEGFEVAFKNSGNVHLAPFGEIKIKNIFGWTVDTIEVDKYFVLPDSTRYREVKWDDKFSMGRYTAELSLDKGYGGEKEEMELTFLVIPWKILISTVLLISAFCFSYRLFRNSKNKLK